MKSERMHPACEVTSSRNPQGAAGSPRRPGRTAAPALLAAAALATALLAGFAESQTSKNRPPQSGATQTPTPRQERAPGARYSGRLLIGDAGPGFSLTAADGQPFRLESLKGRHAVAIVFLQRAESYLSGFGSAGDSLAGSGIRLVFVCQQRLPRQEKGWPGMVIAHDRQGDVARSYGALELVSGDTVPALFLLDRAGKLRYYAVGRLPNPDELLAITLAVLAPPVEQ